MEPVAVSNISLSTISITALCDEMEASKSTGFMWSKDDELFLITNWHCITGVNPLSGKSLSRTGARPNMIRAGLTTSQFGIKYALDIPLFDPDGNALWYVHPTAGEQVDIVAIKVPDLFDRVDIEAHSLARPMNEFGSKRLQPFIGDELMVVGFPRNLHVHGLPLFKRATFASEPILYKDSKNFGFEFNRRQVLIDCATREGMSGSPVLHIKRSMMLRPFTDNEYDDLLDSHKFYGIYSGRILDPDEDPSINDLFAAQIGIVWPMPLIERIVAEGRLDRFRREDAFEKTREGNEGELP